MFILLTIYFILL